MALVDRGNHDGCGAPASELAELRILAAAAYPDPGDRGALAEALRRLHEAQPDPRHPRGLVYYDDTTTG